jgi:hypothetical protein
VTVWFVVWNENNIGWATAEWSRKVVDLEITLFLQYVVVRCVVVRLPFTISPDSCGVSLLLTIETVVQARFVSTATLSSEIIQMKEQSKAPCCWRLLVS